jgi:hypothetical protein
MKSFLVTLKPDTVNPLSQPWNSLNSPLSPMMRQMISRSSYSQKMPFRS